MLTVNPNPVEVCGALPTLVPDKSSELSSLVKVTNSFVSSFCFVLGDSPSYFQFPTEVYQCNFHIPFPGL